MQEAIEQIEFGMLDPDTRPCELLKHHCLEYLDYIHIQSLQGRKEFVASHPLYYDESLLLRHTIKPSIPQVTIPTLPELELSYCTT